MYGYKTDDFTLSTGKPTTFNYYMFNGKYAGNVKIQAQWRPNEYIIKYNKGSTE